jgi:hypothetical protein
MMPLFIGFSLLIFFDFDLRDHRGHAQIEKVAASLSASESSFRGDLLLVYLP